MKSIKWDKFERLLLILTFICTAIATSYAVYTSTKAIKLSSIDLRPWIVIEKINVDVSHKDIKTKFQVSNIGKIPAYVLFRIEAFLNGKPIKDRDIEYTIALMPGQIIHQPGLTITGQIYKQIIKRKFADELIQSIRVNYGSVKEKPHEYFVFQKVKFDQNDFPRQMKDYARSGVWDIIESDFK